MDNTLVKGIALLERLVNTSEPLGVSECARDLEMNKSSVHRLLQTLVRLGYVNAAKGRYSATYKIAQLSSVLLRQMDVRQIARPLLDTLCKTAGETVYLAVYQDDEIVYVDKVEGSQSLRAYAEVGTRAPAHCVSTGKAFLASFPTERVMRFARELTRFTPNTITDPAKLLLELAEVRRRGYAVQRGEWETQVAGLAAPIWGPDDKVVAAVGLSIPVVRFDPPAEQRMIDMIKSAAEGVSRALGASTLIYPSGD